MYIGMRKYGVGTTFDFSVYDIDGVDLDINWVPANADCELIKDGGTSTAIDATAVDEGVTYSITLTATEMQCARGVIKVQDAATKVILDIVMTFDTYGDPSAQHAFDLDASGDWVRPYATGTTDAGGSITTMIDAARTEADNVHCGNYIKFTSGAVIDQVRLIMDFNATTDTITFRQDTTAAIGAGITYELWHWSGVNVEAWHDLNPDLGPVNPLVASGDVQVSVESWRATTVQNLVGGIVDANVGSMAADTISAVALSAAGIDKIRDGLLPTQNAAFNNLEFLFVSSTDHATPVTGAGTMAVTRSIDGAAFGAGTGTGPAEVANGIYQYDASAADMNGGIITFRFTATTGTPAAPDDRFVTVVTGGGV